MVRATPLENKWGEGGTSLRSSRGSYAYDKKKMLLTTCDKIIKEKSAKSKGEECIFCEGSCQAGFIDRILKPVFEALNKSKSLFYASTALISKSLSRNSLFKPLKVK